MLLFVAIVILGLSLAWSLYLVAGPVCDTLGIGTSTSKGSTPLHMPLPNGGATQSLSQEENPGE